MGQPAFAFAIARTGMSASRGIETARLRNSRWRFTEFEPPRGKKQDFKTCHKRFRDFEVGQKFSKTHFFQGTILYPYKWASLPAHINTATILR